MNETLAAGSLGLGNEFGMSVLVRKPTEKLGIPHEADESKIIYM